MNKEYTISRLKRDGFKVESRGKNIFAQRVKKDGTTLSFVGAYSTVYQQIYGRWKSQARNKTT